MGAGGRPRVIVLGVSNRGRRGGGRVDTRGASEQPEGNRTHELSREGYARIDARITVLVRIVLGDDIKHLQPLIQHEASNESLTGLVAAPPASPGVFGEPPNCGAVHVVPQGTIGFEP